MNVIGKQNLKRFVVGSVLAFAVSSLSAQESRIRGAIDSSHVVSLPGVRDARVVTAIDRGVLDPLTRISYMRMVLKPAPAQSADLEQFLERQRDPSSVDYQRWLTPEEFAERFGPIAADAQKVAGWLQSEGFTVERTARARNWIAFSGTAGQVANTFHTELHRFQSDGEDRFSNVGDPSVPEALADIAGELKGLSDFRLRPPRVKRIAPDLTTSTGAHYLAPDDLAAIYDIAPLYKAGYDGTGQKLVIAGQTDINLADLRGFRIQFGLAAKDPQLVLYGPDPGVSSGDQIESNLDLEWAGAVARNATVVFVYSQNVFESVVYAIDENLAPVISMSYGGCELGASPSGRAMVQQANAEGITWMNSSGDSGAAGCDYGGPAAAQYGAVVSYPADFPEVTAVGGSELNETGAAGWSSANGVTWVSATGYIPETGWNDTPLGGGIWASGGGVSAIFSKPWWQTGPGVPADTGRDVPDISLTASGDHDGYLVYMSGQLFAVGGTSASTPSFAGMVALINQYVTAKGIQPKPGLGNINPTLYNLAQNTTGVMHDITTGNNIVPCVAKSPNCVNGSFGYSAGPGYDQVTGLGSVDAYNMVTNWASLPTTIGTTVSLTASPANIAAGASTQLTAKVSAVTGANPPTGSVTFALGGVPLGSAALTASGSAATAILAVKASSLTTGNNSIAATYTATGNFSNSTASAAVTLAAAPAATHTAVTASPSTLASSGTLQLAATVTPASGAAAATGTVTFLAGATPLGTVALAAASANAPAAAGLSVSASKLAIGSNGITASYSGSAAFAGSVSAAVTVTITAPLIATTATLVANPFGIAQSASTVLTVTIKAVSGNISPTGNVTFTAGSAANATLGTATLSGANGTATASLTLKGMALIAGINAITATYGGDGKCSGAIASAAVSVSGTTVSTSMAVAANPPNVAQNASTTITAAVKAASGTAAPAGSVVFSIGNTPLGSANLTPSPAASSLPGVAAAVLSVAGGKLSFGNDVITASYAGASGFAASSGSVLVAVTAPPVATTTTLLASPTSIAAGATTQLRVTVTPANGSLAVSGNGAPTGSIAFTAGNVSLGSAVLTVSGSAASAVFTVKPGSLPPGNDTVAASYSGNAAFAPSTGSASVTVASQVPSNVVATVTKTTNSQPGFAVKLQLQETAGGATTLTGVSINGTNFTPAIASMFGSAQIAAHATLTETMNIQWSPLPATLVFVFNGVDSSGRQWSQTVSISTK